MVDWGAGATGEIHKIGDGGSRRTHVHRVIPLALGDPALGYHVVADDRVRRIAVIGVRPVVEDQPRATSRMP